MLYTTSLSKLNKVERELKMKAKIYVLVRGRESDVVVPDQTDLDQYRTGKLNWKGFRINYLAKLMRPEGDRWMASVSAEAAKGDVILVSDEDHENCYRILLAELMVNMFSGQLNLRYVGEIK